MILGRLSTQPLACTLLFAPLSLLFLLLLLLLSAVQIGLVQDEGGVAAVYLLKVGAADEV